MKNRKFILSLLPICLFNIIYFLWLPFNKHLLPIFSSKQPISDTFTNIIYYFLWFAILIIISETCFIVDPLESRYKRVRRKFIYLIIIQLISDLIKFLFYLCFKDCLYNIICPVLDSLVFILMLIVTIRRLRTYKNIKKYFWCGFTILVFLVFVLINIDIKINNHLCYIDQKYITNSQIYLFEQINTKFLYELTSLSFEIIAFCVIYSVIYYAYNTHAQSIKLSKRDICIFGIRVFFILFLLWTINIKFLIIPKSSLQYVKKEKTYSQSFVNYEHINFDYNELRLFRNPQDIVFGLSKVDIKIDNNIVECFYQSDFSDLEKDSSALKYKHTLNSLDLDGTMIKWYGDRVIVYVENGKSQVFFTKEISKATENPILTKFCKKMVSDCDWNYFEYCAEYLMKYDAEFIMPYIQKYANNQFDEYEKLLNSNYEINTKYIQNIANKLLEIN